MSKRIRKIETLEYADMCTGPNKTHSEYHYLMSKFYSLSVQNQRIFMAMFSELCNARKL